MNDLVGDNFLAEKAAAIRTLAFSAARNLAEIGKYLHEVRERFGRGDNPQFLAWALDTLGWSQATVYRYIKIYKFSQTSDFINVDKIDLDVSSLYLLAAPSTTAEVRAEVIEQATTGTEKVTHKTIKKTVARHAKAKKEKAAPKVIEAKAEIVEPEPAPVAIVEEEAPAEPHYILVEPDAAPSAVHVDPASDVVTEHLREELAARDYEIEDLKSTISGFVTIVKEKDEEIDLLMTFRTRMEDRAKERVIDVTDILAEMRDPTRYHKDGSPHMVKFWKGLESLPPAMMLSKKEVVLLLERRAAIEGDASITFHHSLDEGYRDDPPAEQEDDEAELVEPEESAPPTQPAEAAAQTWEDFVEAYFMADDCPASPNTHGKINAGFVLWADRHGYDIERLAGAPEDVKHLWLIAGKNCRVQSIARNTFNEISTGILKRYGSGRRVNVAVMATDLKCRQKDIASTLDAMFQFDFEGLFVREKEGRETFWTIRRPAKVSTE